MALPTSGQIDLNAIHIEAGGTTGTQCSMEDADIRALISKDAIVEKYLTEWYGASSGPSIGADWPLSDTAAYSVGLAGVDAYAGLSGFHPDGTFEWFDGNLYYAYAYLTQTGGTVGHDFYIRRTSYTGSVITNITTSWQPITQKLWAYVDALVPGQSQECSSITIAISPNASTVGEVTWTGSMYAEQFDDEPL